MKFTAVQAGAHIHHINLRSPDPERLAAFYANAMDMEVERLDGEWLCTGPMRRVIIGQGEAKMLGYGALGCRSREVLAQLRERIEAEGVHLEASPSPLFEEGAFGVRDHENNLILFGFGREDRRVNGHRMHAPIQHLTLATHDLEGFESFYAGKLGFSVTDRVRNDDGVMTTCFTTSNHEHHTIAAFLSDRQGIDHHSYEAGEWITIRDWCDRMGDRKIPIMWGPGRHGPGNNLFVFIEDPDGNWIEISAELEVIYGRAAQEWRHEPYTLNKWGRAIMRA
jgi:catechol 2,3-dioxygenase